MASAIKMGKDTRHGRIAAFTASYILEEKHPSVQIYPCVQVTDRILENVSQPKPAVHSAPKKVLYFSLPYTGAHFLQIRTKIFRLCSSAFPPS